MNHFLGFFVRQKKLAFIFTISAILIGAVLAANIQRERFPEVDFEQIRITTFYPNASPEDVELSVTNPIEDELKNITGIKKYTSTSREGRSTITVDLEVDLDDIKRAKQEVRDAVNRVRDLPSEVKDLPSVQDVKISLRSVLQVNLVAKTIPYDKMRTIVNYLEREINLIKGVASVSKSGYLEEEVKIFLNPELLYKYKIPLDVVLQEIDKRNIRYTLGHNRSYDDERNLVVLSKFDKAQEVSEVVLSSSFNGPEIKLKDVAKIISANEEETEITRVNARKGFVLRIKKQEGTDIIRTVDLVKARIKVLQKGLPSELEIFYSDDLSSHVRNRLSIVLNNGMLGLVLVLLVLGIFLSLRTAFWVALSLPVVLLGLVAFLFVIGETINLVSLAAMILVLGLVVDDSIIIAESIHHYKTLIKDKYLATVEGFKRVIGPVIITMLTTILAFSAMFLMSGRMGKFIYVMPIVVIFALLASFLEITFALPAHLALSKQSKNERQWFNVLKNTFERLSRVFLRFRYLVIVLFIAVFALTAMLGSQMRFTLFPEAGTDKINARVEAPLGSSLKQTERLVMALEEVIIKTVGDELDSVSSEIGSHFKNIARLEIALKPAATRERSGREIYKMLKKNAQKISGAEKIYFSIRRPGPPVGGDVEINLVSENNLMRKEASNKLAEILENIDGFSNLERDDKLGKNRIEVVLDFNAIGRLNIDLQTISRYLRASFNGIEATTIRSGRRDIDFRIYLGDDKQSEEVLKTLKIPNKTDKLIPLLQFAKLNFIVGETDYYHYDGERSTTLSGSINDEKISVLAASNLALKKLNLIENFPQVRAVISGGLDESSQSLESFRSALILSLVGIFLLLVLLFNSYTQPFLILMSIPFSIIGVIIAFYLHGKPISFFTILGTLALIGVIVNDGLILVSHLNYLAKKYTRPRTLKRHIVFIARGATDRLRAVLLTTLTTLAGVIPLAYGLGGHDFILEPMALALGYGLLFGTTMTLILMPALYLINIEIQEKLTQLKHKLRIKFSKTTV